MVLFEFDKIIKTKYNDYTKSNKNIEFIDFKLKAFEKIKKIFPFYFSKINQNYVDSIINLTNIKILLYCIENEFNIKNIVSILIYKKTNSKNSIKYNILLLGTHERFRKYGYGSVVLNNFVEFINESTKSKKKIKILVKSLESSVKFYLSNGFIKSMNQLNKIQDKYENILEFNI